MKLRSAIILISLSLHCLAQNAKVDSLKKELRTAREDTGKANTLNVLAKELKNANPDTALYLAGEAQKLSDRFNFKKGKAGALAIFGAVNYAKGNYADALKNYFNALKADEEGGLQKDGADNHVRIGITYYVQGDYPNALYHYDKALKGYEQVKFNEGVALTLGNAGIVYKEQGDLPRALDFTLRALKMAEQIKDARRIPIWLGNIGVVYYSQGDFPNALLYYRKALKLAEDNGDKVGIALHLGNIGNVLDEQAKKEFRKNHPKGDSLFDQALAYYKKSLDMVEEIGDLTQIPNTLGNIGNVYGDRKQFSTALDYYSRAIKKARELNDKKAIVAWTSTTGMVLSMEKKFPESVRYLNSAVQLAKEIGNVPQLQECYKGLSVADSGAGNLKSSFEDYQLYVRYRDSLVNDANTRKSVQLAMQYDFDKKQAADSIKNAETMNQEKVKHEQEIRQQQVYTFGGAIGFVLMLIIAGISFNAYRQKQKANEIIAHQKSLVEEKQKEILDSIYYAQRIQNNILPTRKYIERKLKELSRA